MNLFILIIGSIPGYIAAWFSLSLGASWLVALCTLSGVGVVCTLILAALIASSPRTPRGPRAMPAGAVPAQ